MQLNTAPQRGHWLYLPSEWGQRPGGGTGGKEEEERAPWTLEKPGPEVEQGMGTGNYCSVQPCHGAFSPPLFFLPGCLNIKLQLGGRLGLYQSEELGESGSNPSPGPRLGEDSR